MRETRRETEPVGIDHEPTELPRTIAGYDIVARIAEGGMGVVYEAMQTSPRRSIALKVLKSALRSTDARHRFEFESGVLGRLRHSCIAQIHEAGSFTSATGECVPFFAMELVQDGRSIHTFCEERELSESERLELFTTVLDGVHHAHQRGVVHRDLKPQNILVDGAGHPKIIDFGIAREIDTEDSSTEFVTRTGQLLGTPQYMSPEQCSGPSDEIDLRTDVYSLGLVLFELLTGALPYRLNDQLPLEFPRIVREQPPAKLSSMIRGRKADDLDTIVGKALAKDPERRYASVAAFADDLRRYLRCEPITARPPTAMYQLRMFAKRNRVLVFGLSIVLVITLSAAVIGSALAVQLGNLAERERSLREQGLVGEAQLAARTVAIEVELRWRILEAEAARQDLHSIIAALGSEGADVSATRDRLQQWLEQRFEHHSATTRAVSWFVDDAIGVQQARVPHNARTIGVKFNFRDYFHGQGRDLTPADVEAQGTIAPLRTVHRSIVFRSRATNSLMVAFSAPIFDSDDESGRVIGVLGMTVELGRFGVLQLGLGEQQFAVLIDSHGDADGRQGLVLHHAELAKQRFEQQREGASGADRGAALPTYYVDAAAVERFKQLRQAHIARERSRESHSWEERLVAEAQPSANAFDDAWHDPVGGRFGGEWLAAFAPVLIRGRPEPLRDIGWIVVVQERHSGVGGM